MSQTQIRPGILRRSKWEKNFVIVTPAHPEVTPRNWTTHALKDMGKCGDLDPPT
jgi:hypothetical protein